MTNNIKITLLTIIIGPMLMISCTGANKAKRESRGKPHKVTLYSGGKAIQEWITEGRVKSAQNSDGYYFMNDATGRLIEVSGDVVIESLGEEQE